MSSKSPDWIELASNAQYIFKSPHIVGGMIYGPEGCKINDKISSIIRDEFEEEGFSLWSFSNRVSKEDLDIMSLSKSKDGKGSFNQSVHWILRNSETTPKEALRPAGESQIYPFWAQQIKSYRQLPDIGKIMLQQRFYRVPADGHSTSTKLEWEVSEGHSLFETAIEADTAMKRYLDRCKNIATSTGIPNIAVESPVWDNNHFNDRSTYLCSILDGALRLFGSAYNQGLNLSTKFKILYQNSIGQRVSPYIADWGIGAFYPALWHNRDDKGFVLPFSISPYDVIIIPIGDSHDIMTVTNQVKQDLILSGYKVKIAPNDDLGKSRKLWETRGYPVRIEIGKNEIQNNSLSVWHRWQAKENYNNVIIPADTLCTHMSLCVQDFSSFLERKLISIVNQALVSASSMQDLKNIVFGGQVGVFDWCGNEKCIKDMYGEDYDGTEKRKNGSIGLGKFIGWNPEKSDIESSCICCGSSAKKEGYWSKRRHI